MHTPKKILMLGAGFVAKPALELLHEHGMIITVACMDIEAAKAMCHKLENAIPMYIDVTRVEELDIAMQNVDIVVSLIPYTFHVPVIKAAIRNSKHVVTTSYISPDMEKLHEDAKKAGILILNECGLDPGIDHFLAIQTIDEVHRSGGKIRSFRSYCGALPAPESATSNPLGYKFSWSPRGVLLALKNPAKFYVDGVTQEVPGADLMDYTLALDHDLVAYPNRDSTVYRDRYHIPEARTLVRNTMRYNGFPEIIKALANVGYLDDQKVEYLSPSLTVGLTWKDLTRIIIQAPTSEERDLTQTIRAKTEFVTSHEEAQVISAFKWIGLYSNDAVKAHHSCLDTLCGLLEDKLGYVDGERDMVILQHHFEIEHQNGGLEHRTVSMTEYGIPSIGQSALAKLVGIPCAVAVTQVLDGSIPQTGVLAPLDSMIVNRLVEELEKCGIRSQVKRSFLQKSSRGITGLNVNATEIY